MSIPKTVIDLREAQNMTQTELAERMHLNKNVMGRIERGERPLRDNEILKMAKIFHVSTDLILGNRETASDQEENKYWKFLKNEKKDVAKQIENIINQVENEADINFYGAYIGEIDRKVLKHSLELGLRLCKEEIL